MKAKRTPYKVEVKNGTQYFQRTVYEDSNGERFFKYNGENYYIFKKGNGYAAPWFNSVRYI